MQINFFNVLAVFLVLWVWFIVSLSTGIVKIQSKTALDTWVLLNFIILGMAVSIEFLVKTVILILI